MTTYEITRPDGSGGVRVEADWTRYNAESDTTKLYRTRRFLWDKCVHTSKPGQYVHALIDTSDHG